MVLDGLKPQKVFYYFEEICNIPHGSGNTKSISDYLVDFAKKRGLKYVQDEHDNVIIFKDAYAGYEASEAVIIQGHIDMVCDKTPEADIDMEKDGLALKVDGNVIYAEGTTLGGDDGIAVAYMLAILDSDDIMHPALECVFTSDEEIGLLGATALDCSMLKGRRLLNIDSEEEGQLLVSCAGGVTAECELPVSYEAADGLLIHLVISGLAGGHSGVEISNQGANANKLLGRVLYSISKCYDIRLVSVSGGIKDNAIPNASEAYLYVDGKLEELRAYVQKLQDIYRSEFRHTDADMNITVEEASMRNVAMDKSGTDNVIASLMGLPNGIMYYSKDIDKLVETSLNLGIMSTVIEEGKGRVLYSFSVRSSVESRKRELAERIECLMESYGGKVTLQGEYPAWEYVEDSKLRKLMCTCYEEMYGKKPELLAIHAGLECGIFAGKLDGLDCVSYGPDIKDIHTTREKLFIDSVARTWDYTLMVLSRLK